MLCVTTHVYAFHRNTNETLGPYFKGRQLTANPCLFCFVALHVLPCLQKCNVDTWRILAFRKHLVSLYFTSFTGISKYSTGRHHVRNFGYYMFLRQRSVDISFISLRTRRFIEFPAPPGVTWLLNQIKLQDTQLEFYFKQNYKTSRTSQIYIK